MYSFQGAQTDFVGIPNPICLHIVPAGDGLQDKEREIYMKITYLISLYYTQNLIR